MLLTFVLRILTTGKMVLVQVDFSFTNYEFERQNLEAISVSASKDDANSTHFSLVNIDSKNSNTVASELTELDIKKINSGSILKSGKLKDRNIFEKPDAVTPQSFKDFKLKGDKLILTLPPFSVIVLEGI